MTAPTFSDSAEETRAHFRKFISIPTRWMDNDMYGHVNNVVSTPTSTPPSTATSSQQRAKTSGNFRHSASSPKRAAAFYKNSVFRKLLTPACASPALASAA
jgi:hypothetical protein